MHAVVTYKPHLKKDYALEVDRAEFCTTIRRIPRDQKAKPVLNPLICEFFDKRSLNCFLGSLDTPDPFRAALRSAFVSALSAPYCSESSRFAAWISLASNLHTQMSNGQDHGLECFGIGHMTSYDISANSGVNSFAILDLGPQKNKDYGRYYEEVCKMHSKQSEMKLHDVDGAICLRLALYKSNGFFDLKDYGDKPGEWRLSGRCRTDIF